MESVALLLGMSSLVILGTLFVFVVLRAIILRIWYRHYRAAGGGCTFLVWSRIRRDQQEFPNANETIALSFERTEGLREERPSVDIVVDFSVWYQDPEERTGAFN